MKAVNHEIIADYQKKLSSPEQIKALVDSDWATFCALVDELLVHWQQSSPPQYRRVMVEKILLSNVEHCKLCEDILNKVKVMGQGNPSADLLVIGEGPGEVEIEQNKPFAGPAGEMLTKILSSVNISRDKLFLTNSIVCRTNDRNRNPTSQEIKNCRRRLMTEVKSVNPKLILAVGSSALLSLEIKDKITAVHGDILQSGVFPSIPVFVMFHPAYLLHSQNDPERYDRIRQEMWEDVQKLLGLCKDKRLDVF
jgi:uracil-DNA glycosylase family 4